MRVTKSHKMLPAVARGKRVTIVVDDQTLEAYQGETVATALTANGQRTYRYSAKPGTDQLPGFFCGMGICYGCAVLVDGYVKRACVTSVVDGMEIVTKPEASQ